MGVLQNGAPFVPTQVGYVFEFGEKVSEKKPGKIAGFLAGWGGSAETAP